MVHDKPDKCTARRIALWAIACVMATSLVGCDGAATQPPPPTAEAVTITFACAAYEARYYKPLIEAFHEQYPNITVELDTFTWRQGGPTYDGDVNVIYSYDLALLEQGKIDLLSLDPLIEQDKSFSLSDFYPAATALFRMEGKMWAIPWGMDTVVMYYNKALFDRYRVAHPEIGWEYDAFLEKAQALTDPEADVFGYGMHRPAFDDALWFVYQGGGQVVDDLQKPRRAMFNDPATVRALERYASLMYEDNIAPTPEQARAYGVPPNAGISAVDLGFFDGKIGMVMGSFSERGGEWYYWWEPAWDIDWGMATLPRPLGQERVPTFVHWGEGLALSAQAQNPAACWQLAVFLSQQIPHRLIPARLSLLGSEAYEQEVGSDIAAVARASVENAETISPDCWPYFQLFSEGVGLMFSGNNSPQKVMDLEQQKADRLIIP